MHFFATFEDLEAVIAYILDELSMKVWEVYSPIDKPIREIDLSIPLTNYGNVRGNVFYGAWHSSFELEPMFETFELNPDIGSHRTRLTGPHIMTTVQGEIMETGSLRNSDFKVWSEAGARQNSNYSDETLDAVNWKSVRRESGRINRFIKNKFAVAKLNSMPILPNAYSEFEAGRYSLWNFGQAVLPHDSRIELLD